MPRNTSQKDNYSISIPKVSLKNGSYTPILMIVLLIAVFFVGRLTSQVQYLQKGATTGTAPVAGNQPGIPTTPAPGAKVNVANGHFPAKGNKSAKVTVIEFADFRCPFCEKFFTDTEGQIFKDYVDTGKIQFYFRQYAFLGPASIVAADAAECANDQGKFWEFHDYLYKNQPPESDTSMYTTDTLTKAAVSLGMDGNTFSSCLSNKTDDSKQAQDLADGQKAGVNGTPTTFINGTPIIGAQPYANIKAAIDAELAK